jgi:hypothetical protein
MSIGFHHGQLGQDGLCHLLAGRVSIRLGAGQEWPDGFTLGRATGSAQPPPPTITTNHRFAKTPQSFRSRCDNDESPGSVLPICCLRNVPVRNPPAEILDLQALSLFRKR